MKNKNAVKPCTEKQRKALVSFLCDNADTIVENMAVGDDRFVRVHNSYQKAMNASDELLKCYEDELFSLMLGEIDGIKMAELAHKLLKFAKEAQVHGKQHSDFLYQEYRNLFDIVASCGGLISKKGLDIDYIDSLCSEAPSEKLKQQED